MVCGEEDVGRCWKHGQLALCDLFFFALISLIPIGFYMDLHGKSMILQEFTCFYIFYTRNMLRNAPQAEVDDVATTATRAMDDGTGGAEEHRVMEDGEVGDLSTWEDTY
jgi:hypothetical protein